MVMRQNTKRTLTLLFVVGAPLLLAILECFHPHPHDLFNLDLSRWMLVHYLQLALFPLTALALITLVRTRHDWAAAVSRVASFVFGVTYIAFDTAAGVVTGILIKAAKMSGNPESWRGPIDAVWSHPVMGGSASKAPFLAIFGSVALSIATVTAALSLKRTGHSWIPVILLAVSGFGIGIFQTHAWPGGPATFGGIGIASLWLEVERAGSVSHVDDVK